MRRSIQYLVPLLLLFAFSPVMGQPPSFLGVTLGEPRETVQATMEESFPEAEDPAVLEDKKTTMVIYKDLSDDYRKLTLHFHPNGRLTGLNLQTK